MCLLWPGHCVLQRLGRRLLLKRKSKGDAVDALPLGNEVEMNFFMVLPPSLLSLLLPLTNSEKTNCTIPDHNVGSDDGGGGGGDDDGDSVVLGEGKKKVHATDDLIYTLIKV